MKTDSITYESGLTFKTGNRVEFWACTVGWLAGTVIGVNHRGGTVFVQPDDETKLHGTERWALNPIAAERAGASHFVAPRDHGVAGGNLRHAS